MSDHKPGQGHVRLMLGNEEVTLKPTAHAMLELSRKYGGLATVARRIVEMDADAVVDVLAHGLGGPAYNTAAKRKELAEKAFAAGLTDDTGGVAAKCVEYITVLMRGGRPAPAPGEDEAAAPGN